VLGQVCHFHTSVRTYLTCARDLAANIGVRFYTPDEYFLSAEPEPFTRDFEPARFLKNPSDEKQAPPADIGYEKINKQDIVLHCGSPGAGKSTFFWKKLEPLGYERVNQDILKTVSLILNVSARHLTLSPH
jgi:bifunctional polynucleotide phosphatase/kinase